MGTATGDYTEWTFEQIDKRVGGPELIELPDGNILAAPACMSRSSYFVELDRPGDGANDGVAHAALRGRHELSGAGLARRSAVDELLLEPRGEDEHLSGERCASRRPRHPIRHPPGRCSFRKRLSRTSGTRQAAHIRTDIDRRRKRPGHRRRNGRP